MISKGYLIEPENAAILSLFHGIQTKYDKGYCRIKQKNILKLLSKRFGMIFCVRTLNYRLHALEKAGLIKRYRQHYKHADGSWVFRATAYYLLYPAKIAVKFFIQTAKKLSGLFRVQPIAHNQDTTNQEIEKGAKERGVQPEKKPEAPPIRNFEGFKAFGRNFFGLKSD